MYQAPHVQRRAFASAQSAWDNAEPVLSRIELLQEHIGEQLDAFDDDTVEAFAEHAVGYIDSEQIQLLLRGLLSLSAGRWNFLRHAIGEDLIAEPLHAIWMAAQERRAEFVEYRAADLASKASDA